MIFLRELVFRPSVQLQIKRPQRRHPIVQHLEHLVSGHSVRSDFEREVIGIFHLFGDAVSQVAQCDEIGFQHRSNFLGRFPNCLALGQIGALLEFIVDLVGGDFLTVKLEFEPVQQRRLLRLGGDALGHQLRVCHRPFRCV